MASGLWVEVLIGPILANIILAILIYFFKIPQSIDALKSSMNSLSAAVKDLSSVVGQLEQRAQITDRVISDILEQSYDSEAVRRDGTKYPRVYSKKKNDE